MTREILVDIVGSLGAGIGRGIIVVLIAVVSQLAWSYA
jgi:hypothetical protein